MAQFVKNYVQDLTQDIQIRHCGTLIFNADTDSNVINVSLYNGQEEAPQTGSVVCCVICSDGSTVPVTGGTISGNTVSVTLGADGLIPGQAGVGIQVVTGGVKTTVFKAIYNVELFETDNVVDPSSRITISVGELVSDIETAVASIPADYSDLLAAIAPTFSTSTAYASGSYVWYSGHLYRFTAAHSAGAWVGTDATQVALADDVSDLKSALTEIYNGADTPKVFTGADESHYGSASSGTGCYVSNRVISAGKYISTIKILANASANGAIFLVDVATSKIIAKKTVALDSGWNYLTWEVKTPSNCYIAFYGTRAKMDFTSLQSQYPDYYLSTDGLYEMSPTNPNVGDTVTISQTVSNKYYFFAIQWTVADGLLYDAIEKISEESESAPILMPPLMTTESSYSTTSGESLYVSNRLIPPNSLLKSVKIKTGKDYTGRILVINADTKKITHAFTINFKAGWNTVPLYVNLEHESQIGVESTRVLFNSYSATNIEYAFCTLGLYEGSPLYSSVGDTLTITQTASTRYYTLAVQWEYETNAISYVANSISEHYAEQKQDIIKANLNNGALLSYKDIAEPIGYMGRWFDYGGKKCTNNDGSELYFKTKGANTITAVFGQISTQTVTPYIAVSIDGGAFVRQQISTQTITLPDAEEHIVRIVIDGMTEAQGGSKWSGTLGVYVDSITVDSGSISGIYPRNKVGMFFGDSVTDGVNALGTGATAAQNSAVNAFPYFCCEELNAVSYRVGYGGSGLLTSGSFHPCADAVDYVYSGTDAPTFDPDFIVINHGLNDYNASKTASDYIAEYENVIGKLRAKYSAVPIFCVVGFWAVQPYGQQMIDMCGNYSNTYFIDSYAWKGDTVDGTHLSASGAENNGKLLAKAILKVLGKSYFANLH
jgi:lysophospholipase L1-like esterase